MAWYPLLPDGRHNVLREGFEVVAARTVRPLIVPLSGMHHP